MSAPAPHVRADDVAEAEAELRSALDALEGARDDEDRIEAALDAAARAYERVQAHHLRLADELDDAARTSKQAVDVLDAERRRFATRVAEAYKNPATDLVLAEAVLTAGDTGTALHRAALATRLGVRGAARLAVTEARTRQVSGLLRQHRVIEAGVLASARERERMAETLTMALSSVRHRVERSERLVTEAREQVARSRARQRNTVAWHVTTSLPNADGKVCPIAGPHGFVDSWGFPRSGGRRHQGVDMFAAHGTPLVAVADGVVRRVWNNRLGGLSIDLLDEHGDRYYYAHLAAASVATGQPVDAGEVIGAVGDSGNARGTPPHLHWQYHPGDGTPVNPYPLAGVLCR